MKLQALADALAPLPDRLLVGLSGGADSVALLRILTLAGKCCGAVHVNHGLRGDESDGDEAFCRELCKDLGIPLTVERLRLPQDAGEGEAREARYRAFVRALAEHGADALALAHQRDDQAETLLLHLMRGSGLQGLCGMAPDAVVDGMRVVRPLLERSGEELRDALREAGQAWREDSTNGKDNFLRNSIRHRLLPEMERLIPGASRRIAETAAGLRLDEAVLAEQTDAFLQAHAGGDWLHLAPWRALSGALRYRTLRRWWQRCAGEAMDERNLTRQQTEDLVRTASGAPGAACNLPGMWQCRREPVCLHLIPPETRAAQQVPACDGAALGGVTLCLGPSQRAPGDGRSAQEVPAALLTGAVLRTMRPGDVIRPFGSGHTRPLEEFMRGRGVDPSFRTRVPLLCRGETILLAAGLGAGDIPAFDETEQNLRITWNGVMPWLLKEETP